MSESAFAVHARAESGVIAMMAAAMRAPGDPARADRFTRQSRTFVLAEGVALTGVLNAHRVVAGSSGQAMCGSCGTTEQPCRTLQRIDDALAAYLSGPPPGIDLAEAWRRADAWFNPAPAWRAPVMIEETADAYLAWAVPRLPRPDGGGLLVIDKGTGRFRGSTGGR